MWAVAAFLPCALYNRHHQRPLNVANVVDATQIATARDVDLVALAEEFGVELELRGNSYWALCPFHAERTKSFTINPARNSYYCFGCEAKGDSISFVREFENKEFAEAVRWLAERQASSSSRLVDRRRMPPPDDGRQQTFDETDLLECLDTVSRAYATELARREGMAGLAREYLRGRGLSAKTARIFGLGFSPPPSVQFFHAERRKDLLEAAGVTFPNSGRDRYSGRLVVPVRDVFGRTIGFGSRTLEKDRLPKYINSPVTPLFAKREALFGLDVAMDRVRTEDEVVVVEGYFDVLALHEIGVCNVIAVLGCSLSASQVERAARFSESRRVVVALDGDNAGAAALDRLCANVLPRLAETAGLDVRVVTFSHGDAADFVLSRNGMPYEQIRREFRTNVLDRAVPWQQYGIGQKTLFQPGKIVKTSR